MEPADQRALIEDGVREAGAVWADLGSGEGAFTAALAGLLPPGSTIYSVERDGRALAYQERALASRFTGLRFHFIRADLRTVAGLPALDGARAANSLHYVKDILSAATGIAALLRPGGRLIVVEYETASPNPWVPYPLPFERWRKVAEQAGLTGSRLLSTRPSRYWREMYCAVSTKPQT